MDLTDIRRESKEQVREIRGDIRERWGLLGLLGLESIPLISGLTFSGIGKATGFQELPLVPIGMDFITNFEGYLTLRGLWSLTKYGIGVAIPYAGEINTLLNR